MVKTPHPHSLTHEWFEQHRQLAASLSRHAVALSVVVFLAIVAVLLVLFMWLQILPDQVIMKADTPAGTALHTSSNAPDPLLEQKKAVRDANLPAQF